jgi:tetratricopeptide (TPR) repeat protein
VAVFEQVCQAVGFAHSVGVIHRDLKPSNVMVGDFGEVQVMDWGLAKAVVRSQEAGVSQESDGSAPTRGAARDGDGTQAGSVKGTPAFMPPEQAGGEWDRVDQRADVFALGGILCAILTGEPPYAGAGLRDVLEGAARGALAGTLARLDASGADPELVALCKRCLAADPENRPVDGAAVAAAVEEYQAAVEDRARRAEAERAAAEARVEEGRKRRRAQLALAVAVGLLLAAGAAFAWWNDRLAAREREERAEFAADKARGEAARLIAEAGAARQQQADRERRTRARGEAASLLDQAEAALRAAGSRRAGETLADAGVRIDEAGADDLRGRLRGLRLELDTLRALDRVDAERWTVAAGRVASWPAITDAWRRAFAGYGITPGTTPPHEAAARISGSLIRERLLTSLELWYVRSGVDAGGRDPALRELLVTADPDDFRNEARAVGYQRALLNRAFRRNPPPPQPTWFAVGHGQDASADVANRTRLLLEARAEKPDGFALYMALGTLDAAGDPATAGRRAGWYWAALAARPDSPTAWTNLGIAIRDSGDLPGALAAFRNAVRLDPEYAVGRNNLGHALRDAGDVPGAVAEFEAALRIDPGLAHAHFGLGLIRHEANDLPGAIAAYREAIRHHPRFLPALLNLGLALGAGNDPAGCEEAYAAALRVDPQNARANLELARLLYLRNEYGRAIPHARRAIPRLHTPEDGYALLGMSLLYSGDVPGAREAIDEAARRNPGKYGNLLDRLPPLDVAPPPRPLGGR